MQLLSQAENYMTKTLLSGFLTCVASTNCNTTQMDVSSQYIYF